MPNNIINRLKIIGSEEEVKKVVKFLQCQDNEKDENYDVVDDIIKVLNTPITDLSLFEDEKEKLDNMGVKIINDIHGCELDEMTIFSINLRLHKYNLHFSKGKIVNINSNHTIDFNKITPMPPWVFNEGGVGEEEFKKYGEENTWYGWCSENWGTKWNAYSQPDPRSKDNVIFFKTAWVAVPELIRKLSWIFPEVTFNYGATLEYCDDEWAEYHVIKDGVIQSKDYFRNSQETFEMSFRIENNMDMKEKIVIQLF